MYDDEVIGHLRYTLDGSLKYVTSLKKRISKSPAIDAIQAILTEMRKILMVLRVPVADLSLQYIRILRMKIHQSDVHQYFDETLKRIEQLFEDFFIPLLTRQKSINPSFMTADYSIAAFIKANVEIFVNPPEEWHEMIERLNIKTEHLKKNRKTLQEELGLVSDRHKDFLKETRKMRPILDDLIKKVDEKQSGVDPHSPVGLIHWTDHETEEQILNSKKLQDIFLIAVDAVSKRIDTPTKRNDIKKNLDDLFTLVFNLHVVTRSYPAEFRTYFDPDYSDLWRNPVHLLDNKIARQMKNEIMESIKGVRDFQAGMREINQPDYDFFIKEWKVYIELIGSAIDLLDIKLMAFHPESIDFIRRGVFNLGKNQDTHQSILNLNELQRFMQNFKKLQLPFQIGFIRSNVYISRFLEKHRDKFALLKKPDEQTTFTKIIIDSRNRIQDSMVIIEKIVRKLKGDCEKVQDFTKRIRIQLCYARFLLTNFPDDNAGTGFGFNSIHISLTELRKSLENVDWTAVIGPDFIRLEEEYVKINEEITNLPDLLLNALSRNKPKLGLRQKAMLKTRPTFYEDF